MGHLKSVVTSLFDQIDSWFEHSRMRNLDSIELSYLDSRISRKQQGLKQMNPREILSTNWTGSSTVCGYKEWYIQCEINFDQSEAEADR